MVGLYFPISDSIFYPAPLLDAIVLHWLSRSSSSKSAMDILPGSFFRSQYLRAYKLYFWSTFIYYGFLLHDKRSEILLLSIQWNILFGLWPWLVSDISLLDNNPHMLKIQVQSVDCFVADTMSFPPLFVYGGYTLRVSIRQILQLCPVTIFTQWSASDGVWLYPLSVLKYVLQLVGFSNNLFLFLFMWCCASNGRHYSWVKLDYLSVAPISLHQWLVGLYSALEYRNSNGTLFSSSIYIIYVVQDYLFQCTPWEDIISTKIIQSIGSDKLETFHPFVATINSLLVL